MEKVIYALWKDQDVSVDEFNTQLLEHTGPALLETAHAVRLNLKDGHVAKGTSPRAVATDPQMDAIVQVWMDTANDAFRAPHDVIISQACSRFEAWLVSESTPLPNTLYPSKTGTRTEGFSQMVFLQKPENQAWEEWRDIWHNSHTRVAIDTQSNFEYQQNLVTRRLTESSGHYHGIVEECFPEAALTDPLTYFDAPGDEVKMHANLQLMMDSVARFIDHSRMDCMPTSQYDIKKMGS